MADTPSLFEHPSEGAAPGDSWAEVAEQAAGCRNCPLWEQATQTVFGVGPVPAEVMFVGEQPGDQEDLQGSPFVGPAGRVLDEALRDAGIDREVVYVTNAVKHFKWTPRGKRRLHQKPERAEIVACRPWLDAELRLVQPRLLVLLGATAAQGIFGSKFRVTASRGVPQDSDLAEFVVATIHPSAILRAEERRDAEMAAFTRDLASAWSLLGVA
ncbi:MAG: UdgX family uracil-DNA binding protein [Actinomycetota bacterium]|nr:UdgX family uracil-DNA binding protein [Actinomycetota bacterium]